MRLTRHTGLSLLFVNPTFAPIYAVGTLMNIQAKKYKKIVDKGLTCAYSAHSINSTTRNIAKSKNGNAKLLTLAAKRHSLAPWYFIRRPVM